MSDVKLEKLSPEFQDCLLIEAIGYINSVRPLLENIKDSFEFLDGQPELKR